MDEGNHEQKEGCFGGRWSSVYLLWQWHRALLWGCLSAVGCWLPSQTCKRYFLAHVSGSRNLASFCFSNVLRLFISQHVSTWSSVCLVSTFPDLATLGFNTYSRYSCKISLSPTGYNLPPYKSSTPSSIPCFLHHCFYLYSICHYQVFFRLFYSFILFPHFVFLLVIFCVSHWKLQESLPVLFLSRVPTNAWNTEGTEWISMEQWVQRRNILIKHLPCDWHCTECFQIHCLIWFSGWKEAVLISNLQVRKKPQRGEVICLRLHSKCSINIYGRKKGRPASRQLEGGSSTQAM